MKSLSIAVAVCAVFTLAASGPLGQAAAAGAQPTPPAGRDAGALFNKSAMRRARTLIQLRILQLREERLECVRKVVLRQIPPDLLLPRVKQSSRYGATVEGSALDESEDCPWMSRARRPSKPTG